MAPDLKSLGIDQMSLEDRVSLLYAIGRTIPPGNLTEAQQAELDKRLDDLDAGSANNITLADANNNFATVTITTARRTR